MLGQFEAGSFCVFDSDALEQGRSPLKAWLANNDPMLIFAHGSPLLEDNPLLALQRLEQATNGFVTGGLASSRTEHTQFADDIVQGGFSGVAFSQDIKVATALSQGCGPIGSEHTITRGDGYMIEKLDGKPALEVFQNDLRVMAIKKLDRDPDAILIDETPPEQFVLPEYYESLFMGEIHAAFPVPGSDQNDYLVRNFRGIDEEDGILAVAETVSIGQRVLFVYRSEDTMREDLSKTLLALRERVQRDTGGFNPRGALYVSCAARAFAGQNKDGGHQEMRLIKDIIGDVPLTGFYAGGEISKARLYGYTGILTLFL